MRFVAQQQHCCLLPSALRRERSKSTGSLGFLCLLLPPHQASGTGPEPSLQPAADASGFLPLVPNFELLGSLGDNVGVLEESEGGTRSGRRRLPAL